MPDITTPRKTTPWTVISSGRISERVPRVSGYQYYALPFVIDQEVDWAKALAGIDPRATLISIHPKTKLDTDGTTVVPNPKAGQVYPTDVTKDEDRENFLGVLVDGHNYETDLNMTVQLQGALELRYFQNDPALPWGKIDPVIEAQLADIGITRIKDLIFWDATRRALR